MIVVPSSSGAPLPGSSGESVIARPNQVCNLPEPVVARAQPSSDAADCSDHPSGERCQFWSCKRGTYGGGTWEEPTGTTGRTDDEVTCSCERAR